MAEPVSAPTLFTKPLHEQMLGVSLANLPLTDGGILSVEDVTAGMVKNLPRNKVPAGSGRVVENGRVRDDWVGRREGTGELGTKPDSNRVIGLFSLVQESGAKLIIRVTQSTVHVWNGASWIAFTVTGGFKGTAKRVSAAQLFDKVYLGFDVADGLWEIDFITKTVTQVDGAPGGRFAINFAERVVLGNLAYANGGPRPNAIAWSANSEPTNWTGESSGLEDLIAGDLGNEITGLVGMSSLAVVMRKQSIVHISRQPFEIAPFRFDTIIPNLGSDLPNTTVQIPGGIIFADARTQDVYLYTPGSLPRSLTKTQSHVHGLLYEDLAQTRHAQATFDPFEYEYHLGLVWTTDNELITRRWVCSLRMGMPIWTYDDSPTLSTLGVVLPPNAPTTINDLTGTINALSGSIDSLSSRAIQSPRIVAGISTGEVIEFSYDNDHDWDDTEFEFTFQSPNIGSPTNRRTMKDLEVTAEIPTTGSVTIEQSTDESSWTNTKTESRTGAVGNQKVRLPKTQITGNDLYWRIVTSAPGFKIKTWWARLMDKGLQQGTQQ